MGEEPKKRDTKYTGTIGGVTTSTDTGTYEIIRNEAPKKRVPQK